jgi:hypothetical protein
MTDETRQSLPALILAVGGLLIAALVTLLLFWAGMKDAHDVLAVAGVFTGITGTLVGTFLGVHVGAAGRIKLQAERDNAMAMLSADQQDKVHERMKSALR